MNRLEIIQLNSYVTPEIVEKNNKEWVLYGENNSFYQDIIDSYDGSPTNSAIIDSYSTFIYGMGLNLQIPLFPKKEVRRIVKDFEMFGEACFELLYVNGKPVKIIHIPKEKVAPEKANDEGDIVGYYYCYDWSKQNKYPPKRFDAFGYGKGNKRSEIVAIKDYQVGQFYFSKPSYLSAIPYAELEKEVANFCVNHVKNKFSVGTIINLNNGIPESEDERNKITRQYKQGVTGTNNAGSVVISFNDNKENSTTVENLTIVDAYQQYQFLALEAENKICVAHKVVSKAMIGINTSTGFSSNADEITTAFDETMLNVIQPKQEIILDAFQSVASMVGIQENLEFLPLREVDVVDNNLNSYNGAQIASAIDVVSKVGEGILTKEQAVVFLIQFLQLPKEVALEMFDMLNTEAVTQLSKVSHDADFLTNLGEEIDNDVWELIDEKAVKGIPELTETALALAKVPSSFPNASSEQDTSLFKIRYSYTGDGSGEREFCAKMTKANKVYRKEDIELAGSKVVNAGLGPEGSDTYNIWLYKGGVNCKHFWMRKIYLRRNNSSLSVNEARKMILALEPEKRKDAMWEQNNPLVAQPAQSSNNFFKLPQ